MAVLFTTLQPALFTDSLVPTGYYRFQRLNSLVHAKMLRQMHPHAECIPGGVNYYVLAFVVPGLERKVGDVMDATATGRRSWSRTHHPRCTLLSQRGGWCWKMV